VGHHEKRLLRVSPSSAGGAVRAPICAEQDIGALPPGWKRNSDKLKMNEIHHEAHMVDVRTLDLNLVRVFDALMEDRSVRRAGLRLHVTQSAVSHALNRLR
jgi:hypothetical protein